MNIWTSVLLFHDQTVWIAYFLLILRAAERTRGLLLTTDTMQGCDSRNSKAWVGSSSSSESVTFVTLHHSPPLNHQTQTLREEWGCEMKWMQSGKEDTWWAPFEVNAAPATTCCRQPVSVCLHCGLYNNKHSCICWCKKRKIDHMIRVTSHLFDKEKVS